MSQRERPDEHPPFEPIQQPYHWPRGPVIRDPQLAKVRLALIVIVVAMVLGLGVILYFLGRSSF